MMTILCNLFINTLILIRFSHAMNSQTPQTGFYLGFIVWRRSHEWPKGTSFLGGSRNEYVLRCNLVHFETQFCEHLCYFVCTDLVTSG